MIGRSVPEWIGRTPDSKVPPHVRLRIFRAADRICHISGLRIEATDPWDLEHVIPLSMGGEHREGNLRPALRDKHKEKSAREAGERAKADAAAKRHIGAVRPKATIKSPPFARTEEAIERSRRPSKLDSLPARRSLYADVKPVRKVSA